MRALALGLGLVAILVGAAGGARADKPLPTDSIYRLDASFVRQDGATIKLASLAGRPVVIAMLYTSCRYTCPMTIAALRRIERVLSDAQKRRVQFVLVSFDPARDTPAVLRRLAEEQHFELARWSLLHASERSARELAALLGFHYRKNADGDFTHDTVLTRLDERGVIREHTSDLAAGALHFE